MSYYNFQVEKTRAPALHPAGRHAVDRQGKLVQVHMTRADILRYGREHAYRKAHRLPQDTTVN